MIAMGNSPSSGSTFLADLLDSTPVSAVGPELNLFGLRQLYNFHNFKGSAFKDRSMSLYKKRTLLYMNHLKKYGLDLEYFKEMVEQAESVEEFLYNFKVYYLSLRGKSENAILFEKSPLNSNGLDEYLNVFEKPFIHIVRDPLHVYLSLKKRNTPQDIALTNWFIEEAKIYTHKDSSKLIIIKYEDLVLRPYEIVSKLILQLTDKYIAPDKIQSHYKNNLYRKVHGIKLPSWKSQKSDEIINANEKSISEKDLNYFRLLNTLKINSNYAKKYNLANVSIEELYDFYGYDTSIFDLSSTNKFYFSLDSKKHFFQKWLIDFKNRDTSLREMGMYLNPLEAL